MNLLELLEHYSYIVRTTGDQAKARAEIEMMVGKNYAIIEAIAACVDEDGDLVDGDGRVCQLIMPYPLVRDKLSDNDILLDEETER